jgi:hypothetical protein
MSGTTDVDKLLSGDVPSLAKVHIHSLLALIQSPTPMNDPRSCCPETLAKDVLELTSLQRRFLLHVALSAVTVVLGKSFVGLPNATIRGIAMQRLCAALVEPQVCVTDPEQVVAAAIPALISVSEFPDPSPLLIGVVKDAVKPGTKLNLVLRQRVAAFCTSMAANTAAPALPPSMQTILYPDVAFWTRRLLRIAHVDLAVHGAWYSCIMQDVADELKGFSINTPKPPPPSKPVPLSPSMPVGTPVAVTADIPMLEAMAQQQEEEEWEKESRQSGDHVHNDSDLPEPSSSEGSTSL